MLIIKPYGFSKTQNKPPRERTFDESAKLTQDESARLTQLDELKNNPDFIIAQWASILDKIAQKPTQKPKEKKTPSPEQREFRNTLGDAIWKLLIEKNFVNSENKAKWDRRVHPYGDDKKQAKDEGNTNRQGKQEKDKDESLKFKGKWYETFLGFLGDTKPEKISPEEASLVANKIYQHLYEKEQFKTNKTNKTDNTKKQGRIDAQIKAISKNVHQYEKDADVPEWSDSDWQAYFKPGDVANEIFNEANKPNENTNQRAKNYPPKPKTVPRDLPGKKLYEHYAKVFTEEGTKLHPTILKDKSHPLSGQFALHNSIKACYKALLDRSKSLRAISLPKDKNALKVLLEHRKNNSELAYLVRLGKVIHYEMMIDNSEEKRKDTIEKSRYWLSDGQREMKRNEAFVRVWKTVITHAAHSLSGWANWYEGDIILAKFCDKCNGIGKKDADCSQHKKIDPLYFDQKFSLFFGDKEGIPTDINNIKTRRDLLQTTIKGWANLRNESFHFRGLGKFLAELQKDSLKTIEEFVNKRWGNDNKKQQERLRSTLKSAHCEEFLTQTQLKQCVEALEKKPASKIELPRLARVLTRTEDTKAKLSLPDPAKKAILKKSKPLLCQYVLLKLLYDRVFSEWLKKQKPDAIKTWITTSCDRATESAKKINKDDLAEARTKIFSGLNWDRDDKPAINIFFERLTAETTRHFRIERSYGNNPAETREQSEFIENLKCEVMAYALDAFLREKNYTWLAKFNEESLPQREPSTLAEISNTQDLQIVDPWQKNLYFLLHMVPVGEIANLLAQLRKWQIHADSKADNEKELYEKLEHVMTLYLDMHDAQFDGGTVLKIPEQFKQCFEEETDFDGEQYTQTEGLYIPLRGLREMLRFGDWEVLSPAFKKSPIKSEQIKRLQTLENENNNKSQIAQAQEKLNELHQKWIKEKKSFTEEEDYKKHLKTVEAYRELNAQVNFNNHVRLHGVLMKVLGRLIDYAGIWERDIYFVLLALLDRENAKFTKKLKEDLKEGSKEIETLILDKEKKERIESNLKRCWLKYFGIREENGRDSKILQIRNNFSHFNMLQSGKLNLTSAINEARELMSYDRKLKNAVSTSIKEQLEREGLVIEWAMEGHQLEKAKIKSNIIYHLKDKISEQQHGKDFCQMVAHLFSGIMSSNDHKSRANNTSPISQPAPKNRALQEAFEKALQNSKKS